MACGADLVLELPLPRSLASAEGFGDGAVAVLAGLGGVRQIAFGMEESTCRPLQEIAAYLLTEEFERKLRLRLGGPLSYAAAREEVVAERFPGKPYILFGHSMGSFLARTYLIQYKSGLDGAIISGTGQQSRALVTGGRLMSALEMRRHGATYKSTLLNNMAFGSYTKKLGHVRTPSDWLSRDESVVDQYIEDPLSGFVPSAGLLHDMMEGIEFISKPKNIAKMKKDLPILFFSGDCDPVGEQGRGVTRAYKAFRKAGMTSVTMKLYHGGRHEMLNEINKDEVYQDILHWLNGISGK